MKRHVIIGTSAAGLSAAKRLALLAKGDEIICISDEQELPYNKCHLASYLCGEKQEADVLTMQEEEAFQKGVTLKLGVRVLSIDTDAKEITCDDGSVISYDTLFIGTGSSPKIPPILNINTCENVCTFHSLNDTNRLLDAVKAKQLREAVIIGAGLSGLECADALREHGVAVHVVELCERVLVNQVNQKAADLIHEHMKKAGVQFYPNQQVTQILDRDGAVAGVQLADGRSIIADTVIVAAGLKPNTEILQSGSIELKDNHIVVNEYMQTSIPGVFAGGDACMVPDQITGSVTPSRAWPDAMLQGMVAAFNMAGTPRTYPGAAVITSSSFFSLKFATCGVVVDIPQEAELRETVSENSYECLVLQNGILKGFCLVGDTSKLNQYRRAVLTKQTL